MQLGSIFVDNEMISIKLPKPDEEVIQGVRWGAVESFLTPAYWAYQVHANRIMGNNINYKLGETLKEEVGACLLGGHGIPANVGLAAFYHVKSRGAFGDQPPTQESLLDWLKEPIEVEDRQVRYRFANQKSRYLHEALRKLSIEKPPISSGKALRNWLLTIPGIGYKTASWIARNWLDADDVAILDIHILRAGLLGNFFKGNLTVERHYLELEAQFIHFSEALGVRASELDALMWLEMMSSSSSVHNIMGIGNFNSNSKALSRSKKSKTNPRQLSLLG
ncbi:MAG: 8-oxoguanine DNA glycosylase [Gammaproteobacteria bacterium]|jgi:thermostable 8-oxoguanine DNA glycosylase|nr:8-oxoguanine DNA glycosylase [Gammaproteobacteria bacterium]MBU1466817.1 8-oxoguanine DNA glycosylase [Gammaproteobacteria bacterium]MBU2023977.1 8-oxoguanine DNA glycosylase [Gammaproteobacteria bacterium]MBU2239167.1 8-oxoguanine DNA glycosylase [Gammaproteobacteria bacterium]MBU2319044.1 8-oxoguanine DNA glycosylase [Gammaproteobacteria bacterium]